MGIRWSFRQIWGRVCVSEFQASHMIVHRASVPEWQSVLRKHSVGVYFEFLEMVGLVCYTGASHQWSRTFLNILWFPLIKVFWGKQFLICVQWCLSSMSMCKQNFLELLWSTTLGFVLHYLCRVTSVNVCFQWVIQHDIVNWNDVII